MAEASQAQENVLPNRPIEVVKAHTLEGLEDLLKKTVKGQEEENRKKSELTHLEKGALNAEFVMTSITPIVKELFDRSNYGPLTLSGNSLSVARFIDGDKQISYLSGSDTMFYNKEGVALVLNGIELTGKDMLQRQWDRQDNRGVRETITKFGELSKAELIAKFGDFIKRNGRDRLRI